MKKFKITDGLIKKVEKTLLKVAKQQYGPDGIYLEVDNVSISQWDMDDFSVEYQIRWGKMADGKCVFQHNASIYVGDGNPKFLAGQFYQVITADGNEN